MPNYNRTYVGPAPMLLSLRDELNAVFPGRFTGTDGFITGYGQYGRSSHNPDNHGYVMAFDISTPANGQHITEAEGRALADYLRTKQNVNFRYLIHDQGPTFPQPMIAGDPTWSWRRYVGDDHSNHIHISLTDDYLWGDSCGLDPKIYMKRVYWGIKEWYDAYRGVKPPVLSKPPSKPVAKPVSKPVPKPVPKENDMPKFTRIYPSIKMALAKGVSTRAVDTKKNVLNLASGTGGPGIYDIDLFVHGTGLGEGETLEIQFFLVPAGNPRGSGYFPHIIHGSKSGVFKVKTRFKTPVSGIRVEVALTASCEGVNISTVAADINNFVKG